VCFICPAAYLGNSSLIRLIHCWGSDIVRIPLDYYRILGLPAQATLEQLQQAHRDRVLQLPRREYSEAAISARRELLDEAYATLSDGDDRKAYDSKFFQQASFQQATLQSAGASPVKPVKESRSAEDPLQSPTIEIEDHQLIGALLLLQELGEYEMVVRLGSEYLTRNQKTQPKTGKFEIVAADIALTVALGHLELGREHWQQSRYERAAESLEAGQDLLLREGLFAGVRGEIRNDLYKLRPYRVLELVSLPLEQSTERRKGLQVLRDMLQERGGVEGGDNDQSGLGIDDFLRFVQQLRDFLTAEEQQALFEAESRRPSAVATYLAIYALMARSFAEHQPALARRAKLMLARLSKRQDVHLEQSVCALMLGQTEEASRALELSHEYAPLAFIREHSQGAPDLLPGLCLYAERWFQDEVFPHFRDLAQCQATLKSYFADPKVQAYLEELPSDTPLSDDWEVVQDQPAASRFQQRNGGVEKVGAAALGAVAGLTAFANRSTATATLEAPTYDETFGDATYEPVAAPSRSAPRRRKAKSGWLAGLAPWLGGTAIGAAAIGMMGGNEDPGNNGAGGDRPAVRPRRKVQRRGPAGPIAGIWSAPLLRWLLLGSIGFLALWLFWSLLSMALGSLMGRQPSAELQGEQLMISLDQPLIQEAPVAPTSIVGSGPMTNEQAQQAIDLWFKTKVEALGPNHKGELLTSILSGAALSQWQGEVAQAKQDGIHVTYQHSATVESITADPANADRFTVNAKVNESRQYIQQGSQLSNTTDDLRMRYEMIRQAGQWTIDSMAEQQ
jgi:curved DNA-binding protein CbpA